jgi:phosphatidylglycerol:prolipoprotein diacylglycerol transferase
MINWLVSTPPNPILWQIGNVQLRWYGLILALALAAGVWLALNLAKKSGIQPEKIFDLALVASVSAIIGARVFHVLEEWSYYGSHLGDIYKFWQGGLAFHGVLFGGVMALFWWCRKNRIAVLKMLDLVFPALVLGQVIGRWGNWFNQELYGRPTDLPWAIPIQPEYRLNGFENFTTFHPLFLYESLGNLLILLVLLIWWRWPKKKAGDVAAVYLMLSPALRFGLDFLRLNQTSLGPLTYAQIFSLLLILVGLGIFIYNHSRKFNQPYL